MCLDPTTKRVYISRHVVFDETTFPFKTSCEDQPNDQTTENNANQFLFCDQNCFAGPCAHPIQDHA